MTRQWAPISAGAKRRRAISVPDPVPFRISMIPFSRLSTSVHTRTETRGRRYARTRHVRPQLAFCYSRAWRRCGYGRVALAQLGAGGRLRGRRGEGM
jgi:hypothetical protein